MNKMLWLVRLFYQQFHAFVFIRTTCLALPNFLHLIPPLYYNSFYNHLLLSHSNLHAVSICISDVVVQLPDKKSIIMYVTSLFAVLPKDVSMEAIREVETLPRKYKAASEEAAVGLSTQVNYTQMFEL